MTLLAQFAATGGALPAYIEDVFSTWLYTGNAPSSQSINNGIDLAGKGGLVWLKNRSVGTGIGNELYNTAIGAGNFLSSNNTNANTSTTSGGTTYGLSAFNSNGFTVNDNWSGENTSGQNIASWTFRKQPKFFDVVTYTGNGVDGRAIAHNLGSAPGCIIVKCTSNGGTNWVVYHRGAGATKYLFLNTTDPASTAGLWYNTDPTSTNFYVGNFTETNASGYTYVAYLFAHNAGGFGLTGTDNVISCGSFTTDASGNATVNLGYEPQWVMWKAASTTGGWNMLDNMRGFTVGGADALLNANSSSAETSIDLGSPTATGFTAAVAGTNATYIYIAIRRGPMKVPTDGTTVFSPIAANNSTGTVNTTGFPVDLQIATYRSGADNRAVDDRLRGVSTTATESGQLLRANTTDSEVANYITRAWDNTGFQTSSGGYGGLSAIYWNFRRAPGFFDEVCYTGTGAARTISHNLGVAPELIITKQRSAAGEGWGTGTQFGTTYQYLLLNSTAAATTRTAAGDNFYRTVSSTSYDIGIAATLNASGATYVAYLFATCPGVSKVGSYTGTGTTQQINCGFTAGARFVLIKRADSTGDWYVWDTARGIVAGNDPYLLLNSTAAEVTGTDYVDTYTGGFEISSTAPAAINANGGTFIYLAIA